jgi:hypothetical protein
MLTVTEGIIADIRKEGYSSGFSPGFVAEA